MVAWVALAGAAGALARYLVHGAVQSRIAGRYPWGTFVVNVTGSLALGFVTGLLLYRGLDSGARTIVATGFLGAYTTFSSYAFEAVGLARDGERHAAVAYAVGSIVLGLAASTAGLGVADLL